MSYLDHTGQATASPTPPAGQPPPNPAPGGMFQNLVQVWLNINRVLSGISASLATLANGVINLGNNNIFTGINSFLAGLIFQVRVVTAAGAVTITSADYIVVVNKTVGAATTVNLPAGVLGMYFVIKDGRGDAGTNNITITPAAGNIDGSPTLVISTNFGVARIVFNGSQWNAV